PGHITCWACAFRAKYHRETLPLSSTGDHVCVVLEHRYIRDVNRIAVKPPIEISHVLPRAKKSQARCRKSRNREAAVICRTGRRDVRRCLDCDVLVFRKPSAWNL